MKKYYFFFFFFPLAAFYAQSIVINEAMSSNVSTLADEDGEFPDWVELYNTTALPVSLANFGLSDDPKNLTKWKFPNITIPPKNFLIVYASGKDKKSGSMFWETIITKGDLWKYLLPVSEPSSAWRYPGFDDTQWRNGPSGFGFGDSDDATIIAQTNAVYIRKTFTITDPGNIDTAFLHVDYDDSFVAYLNGVEIARANIGTKGIPPVYTQTASSNHEAVMYQGGSPDPFPLTNVRSLLKVGENVLAMQVHNINAASSDLTLIPFFTLGLKTPPLNPRGLSPLLNLPSSYLHTNFKLDADGETIILTDSAGNKIDELTFGYIPTEFSFGRKPDGGNNWFYFEKATPKFSNTSTGISQVAEPPQFSKQAGFYYYALSVALTSTLPGGTIYYTTDGSDPLITSAKYIGAITISKTTTLRAKVFADSVVSSQTTTATYFINHISTLPVVSLSTDPKHFWDRDSGIYVMGPNPGTNYPYFGANFWQDWERPIHFEFFEPGDSQKVSVDAGIKIYGNWSRAFDQKSLAIYLRGSYGFNKMKYQFYPGKKTENFENVVLRNGGNDFTYTLLRDRYMSRMFENLDIGVQATRFCVVYLNNEYWGIHTFREKLNEEFLSNTYGVDPANVDIVDLATEIGYRSNEHFSTLYDFISQKDISAKVNYDFVQSQMEVENYKNYQIAEIYANNTDWPGNNMKVWRERTETGKWKWLTYDLDYCVGLAEYIFPQQDYKFNTLAFATATNGPAWPNPPWSTLMLCKFLTNNDFKNDFITSFAHLLNTTFSPDSASLLLNQVHDEIAPEINRHTTKWKNTMQNSWETNISRIRTFVQLRDTYMRAFIISKFQLGGLANLTLTVNDTLGGSVALQSYPIDKASFKGKYFKNTPITLTAKPKPGFVFAGWKGISTNPEINVTLTGDSVVQAIFVKDAAENQNIVINEINYKSSSSFDCGDWIELYNSGKENVILKNWKLKDDDDSHEFLLPEISLEPDAYLILANDSIKFRTIFPNVINMIGNFSFGLSSTAETVRLYNENGTLIDSVGYTSSSPWALEPNGTGATLALINPALDNTLAENWKASFNLGTPGGINDVFVKVENENNQPKTFELFQNYPNPFNPSTVISYQLSVFSKVSLKVFDILGTEVATLVNEEKPAGSYNYELGIRNYELSSGVYFYQLRSSFSGGSFLQTKKMIILK